MGNSFSAFILLLLLGGRRGVEYTELERDAATRALFLIEETTRFSGVDAGETDNDSKWSASSADSPIDSCSTRSKPFLIRPPIDQFELTDI